MMILAIWTTMTSISNLIIGVIALTSLIIAIVALVMGLWAVVSAKALQNSTHTLVKQMQPVDDIAFPTDGDRDFTMQFEQANTDYFIDKEVDDGEYKL